MKKMIALLSLALLFSTAYAQQRRQGQGIGVRFGDPMGITYKKYLGRTKAFLSHFKAVEFGVGSALPSWHRNYYENSFELKDKFDGYNYRSHTVSSTIYLQGRYLLHYDIHVEGLIGKWDWYWGAGGLFKAAKINYRFRDTDSLTDETSATSDVDFGPEGIAGMEYTFEDVPVTIYGDISLMIELLDRFTLRPFAGVGARYNF